MSKRKLISMVSKGAKGLGKLPEELYDRAIEGGGFTAKTDGTKVSKGYSVSVLDYDDALRSPVGDVEAGQANIAKAIEMAKDKNMDVGAWVEDGELYVDVVLVTPDKKIAEMIAAKGGQDSFADLGAIEKGDWDNAYLRPSLSDFAYNRNWRGIARRDDAEDWLNQPGNQAYRSHVEHARELNELVESGMSVDEAEEMIKGLRGMSLNTGGYMNKGRKVAVKLTKGEIVLPPDVTDRNLAVLERMNEIGLQARAMGGVAAYKAAGGTVYANEGTKPTSFDELIELRKSNEKKVLAQAKQLFEEKATAAFGQEEYLKSGLKTYIDLSTDLDDVIWYAAAVGLYKPKNLGWLYRQEGGQASFGDWANENSDAIGQVGNFLYKSAYNDPNAIDAFKAPEKDKDAIAADKAKKKEEEQIAEIVKLAQSAYNKVDTAAPALKIVQDARNVFGALATTEGEEISEEEAQGFLGNTLSWVKGKAGGAAAFAKNLSAVKVAYLAAIGQGSEKAAEKILDDYSDSVLRLAVADGAVSQEAVSAYTTMVADITDLTTVALAAQGSGPKTDFDFLVAARATADLSSTPETIKASMLRIINNAKGTVPEAAAKGEQESATPSSKTPTGLASIQPGQTLTGGAGGNSLISLPGNEAATEVPKPSILDWRPGQ